MEQILLDGMEEEKVKQKRLHYKRVNPYEDKKISIPSTYFHHKGDDYEQLGF